MSGEIDQLKANTQQAQEDEQVSMSDKVKNIYNFCALINVEEGTTQKYQPPRCHLPIPAKQVQSGDMALR